ncbi:MAG TPA: amino acid permease, partial [Candidatus Hydrogenedentes bacterium]|nr:amino acid permease [Candidatus Hydrogenedentota bacterium]
GFEASADLAEETRQPRRVIPRAMLTSLLSSGIGGFLMLVGFMLVIDDVRTVQSAPQPLLHIIEKNLGPKATPFVVGVVLISIFACAVASMAATSRLIYSLARDNMLPGSTFLRTINPARRTPSIAIIMIGTVSSLVVLWFEKLSVITSISATAGYLGYAGIILSGLITKREFVHTNDAFRLGVFGPAVRIAALIWTLLLVFALTLPDTGDSRLPLKATSAAIAIGCFIYFTVIRGRILRGEAGPPSG